MTEHLSEYMLDRALTEELDASESMSLQAHLAQCNSCRSLHESMLRQHSRFLASAPSMEAHAQLVAALSVKPKAVAPAWQSWRIYGVGSALVLAASALLMLRSANLASKGLGTRSKGDVHLGYFVKQGARVVRGTGDTPVHPGDVLRFIVSSPHAAFVGIFGGEGTNVVTYFPRGNLAARLEPGSDVPLDFGVELDDVGDRETIRAVFCLEPFDVQRVRERLQVDAEPMPDLSCVVRRLVLRKSSAP